MSKRLEIDKYGPDSYDDFFCLRPPWLLIASSIFLCRGLVVFVLVAASRGAATRLDYLGDAGALSAGGSLATVPAALVLYALGARAPTAPAFVRWIWMRGRALVSLSALAYIYLSTFGTLGPDPLAWVSDTSAAEKAVLLAELGIIAYVSLSSRVRQTFRDFPAA
jgi:DUF2919 family protein